MITPHIVSLISFHSERAYLTILRGVMLQALNGRSTRFRGDADENSAVLYIPFSVHARNEAGESVSFLPPLEYARCSDPEKHWTLQPEGTGAGRCSFFVKAELSGACTLAEARRTCDDVYIVAGYYVHDYGSPSMRHYEVVSKVNNRYYEYN